MGFEDFAKAAIQEPTEDISIDYSSNFSMANIQYLKTTFANRYNLSKEEYRNFVMYSNYFIFNSTNMKDEYDFLLQVITDVSYLKVLLEVVKNTTVDGSTVVCINKMIYKAFRELESGKLQTDDSYTARGLLFSLSDAFNLDKLRELFTIQIDRNLSTRLNIAYNSSSNTYRKILNVNHELVHWGDDLSIENTLTEQDIVNIYMVYFKHMSDLFIGIMLDHISIEEYNELPEANQNVYSTIDLALLDMCENYLSTPDLVDVLRAYGRKIPREDGVTVRFNLASITEIDYPRIIEAVNYLNTTENALIP